MIIIIAMYYKTFWGKILNLLPTINIREKSINENDKINWIKIEIEYPIVYSYKIET